MKLLREALHSIDTERLFPPSLSLWLSCLTILPLCWLVVHGNVSDTVICLMKYDISLCTSISSHCNQKSHDCALHYRCVSVSMSISTWSPLFLIAFISLFYDDSLFYLSLILIITMRTSISFQMLSEIVWRSYSVEKAAHAEKLKHKSASNLGTHGWPVIIHVCILSFHFSRCDSVTYIPLFSQYVPFIGSRDQKHSDIHSLMALWRVSLQYDSLTDISFIDSVPGPHSIPFSSHISLWLLSPHSRSSPIPRPCWLTDWPAASGSASHIDLLPTVDTAVNLIVGISCLSDDDIHCPHGIY